MPKHFPTSKNQRAMDERMAKISKARTMIIETWYTERVDNEDGSIEYVIYRTRAEKDKPALVDTNYVTTIYENLDSEDMFDAKGIAESICKAMNSRNSIVLEELKTQASIIYNCTSPGHRTLDEISRDNYFANDCAKKILDIIEGEKNHE